MAEEKVFGEVKDSGGPREEFESGSVRDTEDGKGAFDLLPPGPLRRLAVHYQNGAKKYSRRNWEKGQRLGRYLSSAMRHIMSILEGKHDEDHEAAVAWNMFAFMFTADKIRQGKLPKELDDLNWTNEEVK